MNTISVMVTLIVTLEPMFLLRFKKLVEDSNWADLISSLDINSFKASV
jgi:hypothetical protein